jgi:hypothetical protein
VLCGHVCTCWHAGAKHRLEAFPQVSALLSAGSVATSCWLTAVSLSAPAGHGLTVMHLPVPIRGPIKLAITCWKGTVLEVLPTRLPPVLQVYSGF